MPDPGRSPHSASGSFVGGSNRQVNELSPRCAIVTSNSSNEWPLDDCSWAMGGQRWTFSTTVRPNDGRAVCRHMSCKSSRREFGA